LPARLLRDQNRQPSVAHGTLQDADLMAQRKILQSEFTLRSEERASGSGQTSGDVQHDPSGMPGLPEILKDFAADQFLVGTGSRLVLIEGNSVPGSSNPGRSTEWWSAAGSRPLAASVIGEAFGDRFEVFEGETLQPPGTPDLVDPTRCSRPSPGRGCERSLRVSHFRRRGRCHR
jgi:hypothetical protein